MPIPLPNLDDRTFADLVEETRALIPRYAPAWTDHNVSDPGIMLVELFAWLTEALIYRLNRIPEASEARFLELLGATFGSARPATARLVVTASGLEGPLDIRIPHGQHLTASLDPRGEAVAFETLHALRLTPETPSGTVEVRQTVTVQGEWLGASDGRPHQVFPLAQSFLALDPDGTYPMIPQITVGGEAWTFKSSLLDSAVESRHFTAEPRLNAIRFGDGRLGGIPPQGAEIVASYRHTLGAQGNLPADATFAFEGEFGVPLSVDSNTSASGGTDPTRLQEARDQAMGDLKTRWRAITAEGFQQLVLGQAGFDIARAKCLPELDLTSSGPEASQPGHVSVVVVPRPKWQASINLPSRFSVNAVALSPDGRRVAIASNDGTARLWDMEIEEELALLPHGTPINALVFSLDGQQLATISDDGTARLWDVKSATELADLPHEDPVNAVVFSPDGRQLATASDDHTARLWNAESGEETALLRHEAPVNAVTFRPDGKQLAAACDDGTARLWDVESGEEITRLPHAASVNALVFSLGGQQLATISDDGMVRVWHRQWDHQTGEETIVLRHELPHKAPVHAVVFSPAGDRLTAVDDDRTARLWEAKSGEEIAVLLDEAPVDALVLSPEGRWLATVGDELPQVWDLEEGRQMTVLFHDAPVKAMAFNSDGQFLVTLSDALIARVWRMEHIHDIWGLLDERRLITCQHHVVGPHYVDVRIRAEVVRVPQVRKEDLEEQIVTDLRGFFHPLTGGPEQEKNGWPFGRAVYASEVYQVIESTEGVDHAESLALDSREWGGKWAGAGDRVSIPPNSLVHLVVQAEDIVSRAGH